VDPHFSIESGPPAKVEQRGSWAMGFVWLTAWIVLCGLVLVAATLLESWLPSLWSQRLSLAAVLLVLCLLMAVFVNILSRLYLWFRNYIYADQPDVTQSRQIVGNDNQPVQLKGPPEND
jgi:glucan phosphoethanolaminetransferase (alkaline phosphatase superfamily)